MYQIELYDHNRSPICDGVVRFFVDNLENFEKNWFPHNKSWDSEHEYNESVIRYLKSKAGEIVTDYYSDDPKLNIVQKKKVEIIAERSYVETDVTKNVYNVYRFPSTYHMDHITYYIRYVRNASDGELLKLCRYEIRGICYDGEESYWMGEDTSYYEKMGFEACRHLVNEKYLPVYHLYENGESVALYHPRYQYVSVFGNPFVNLSHNKGIYSDNLEDFKDTEASLYVWHIVKRFEDEDKLKNNVRHYRLGKYETQLLLMDFPGEAG
ncbi:MAG: hypothetical protein E7294_03935 [Lachnospiraceae bacterium]|nr:hypothetical protein [Lachnospiraceae bacterium]